MSTPELVVSSAYFTRVQPHLVRVRSMLESGSTTTAVAASLGVSKSVFEKYIRQFTELADVVSEARAVADAKVQSALFKRAIGYEYVERKDAEHLDPEGGIVSLSTATTKDIAGDVGAQRFWLTNRAPEEWRDVKAVDLAANVDITVTLPQNQGDGFGLGEIVDAEVVDTASAMLTPERLFFESLPEEIYLDFEENLEPPVDADPES